MSDDFNIEDDPAKVEQANAADADDQYPEAPGWCAKHDAPWYSTSRRCDYAMTYRNARHTCRQRDDIG